MVRQALTALSGDLAFLVEYSPIGMAILERVGDEYIIIYANKSFEPNTSIQWKEGEKIILKEAFSDLDAEDLRKLLYNIDDTFKSGKENSIQVIKKGKSIRINIFKISEIRLGCTFRDVSVWVQKERELLTLIDGLPSPAVLINNRRQVITMNRHARELGMDASLPCYLAVRKSKLVDANEEAIECDLISDSEVKCSHCKMEEAFESGSPQKELVRFGSKYVEIWWIPISQDIFLHYLVDVTDYVLKSEELKKYSEMLQKQKGFYEYILDNIPIGIMIVESSTHKILSANIYTLNLFGIGTEELTEHTCFELLCNKAHEICPLHKSGDTILNSEFNLSLPDGNERLFIRNEVLRTYDDLKFVIITFTDITEIKKLNERLLEAYSLAEKLNAQIIKEKEKAEELAIKAKFASEAKSQFLASMSHEIRTPLNAVVGFSELLMNEPIGEEQKSYVDMIYQSGKLLLDLIDDILDFSKIEAGRVKLEETEFDILSLTDEVLVALSPKVKEKNIELVFIPDPDLPHKLLGDPKRLKQIFLNLAGNAVKYTDKGYVKAELKVLEQTTESLKLQFRVEDTGPGIPEGKLRDIFEPFEQAGRDFDGSKGGVGLGLAITQKLVELMAGRIGVESKLGEGSVFWVELPLKLCSATQLKDSFNYLTGKRCLVVDDFHGNCVFLEKTLKAMGLEVVSVQDPLKAIHVLHEASNSHRPFHILITDQEMPFIKGTQLIESLKANSIFSGLNVVLSVSVGEKVDESDIKRLGIDYVLYKPLRVKEIQRAIERIGGVYTSVQEDRVPMERLKGIKVLVVEDNLVNQKVARAMLEKMGIHVDLASNGQEALSLLRQNLYHIVFMDIEMPGMDGFETTRRIRDEKQGLSKDIPIIAMTAHATVEIKDACIAAGMNDYITKPISQETVRKVLERWVKGSKTNEDTKEEAEKDTGQIPIFERDKFLQRLGGDEELAKTLLQVFASDVPNTIEQLKQALEEGDVKSATRHAHTIKGAAANVSAERLRASASKIEELLKEGDVGRSKLMLPLLEKDFQEFLIASTS